MLAKLFSVRYQTVQAQRQSAPTLVTVGERRRCRLPEQPQSRGTPAGAHLRGAPGLRDYVGPRTEPWPPGFLLRLWPGQAGDW